MSKALELANGDLYRDEFATKASPTFTGVVTVADGSNDLNVASHDGTNGLKLSGSVVTATATDLNVATNLGIQTAADNSAVALSIALG